MQILTEILAAKENRQTIRHGFAKRGFATISLNFNIPGYPKSDEPIQQAFLNVQKELQNYLTASRIPILTDERKVEHDQAGDICFFPIKVDSLDLNSVKEDLEAFEANHFLGRLLDVDLFDANRIPISSGKKKACFLCKDKAAIECMREERHSFEELRAHIAEQIKDYLESERKKDICNKLSELATKSILMEISLPGKPGLVCPDSQGSHTDMNYLTFVNSTSAIGSYFKDIARIGYGWDGISNKQILQKIRTVGLEMEQAMLRATDGINTQKGIIFLMGFSLFAAAHVLKTKKIFDVDLFRGVLKLLNQGIVGRELENGWNRNASNGEKCFYKYGKEFAGGIRQEIEQGLPIVFEVSLSFMHELFEDGLDINNQEDFQEKLLQVLIKIMSINNDTNILHRANIEVLNDLKELAKSLEKKDRNLSEDPRYIELMEYCKVHNISPGGSADLLAITIFVYQVMKFF